MKKTHIGTKMARKQDVSLSAGYAKNSVAIPKLTEAQFMRQVIEYAKLRGFKVAHFRKVRVARANGSVYWETPVAADGAGFPDLILVRRERLIAAELKVGKNKPTDDQTVWLSRFRDAGNETALWYPSDWKEIEEVLR